MLDNSFGGIALDWLLFLVAKDYDVLALEAYGLKLLLSDLLPTRVFRLIRARKAMQ